VRGAGLDPVRDDVIDRELQPQAPVLRPALEVSRRVDEFVLDERLPDREAARLEEGVGHRAADQQGVDLAEQVLDHLELARHLRAAEDRHKRPLRRFERAAGCSTSLAINRPAAASS
jgi:hypothetical protein